MSPRLAGDDRHAPTRDLLALREALAWNAAELGADPAGWDCPAQTAAYLSTRLADLDREIGRRERLRDHPLAPAWPERTAEVEAIRERVDLVALIERDAAVAFVRCGAQLRAFCPFPDHPARSAGFAVHPTKKLWHCFGCGRGGDCFSFVQEWLGVAFPAAVDLLAREAGIDRPAPSRPNRPQRGVAYVG